MVIMVFIAQAAARACGAWVRPAVATKAVMKPWIRVEHPPYSRAVLKDAISADKPMIVSTFLKWRPTPGSNRTAPCAF